MFLHDIYHQCYKRIKRGEWHIFPRFMLIASFGQCFSLRNFDFYWMYAKDIARIIALCGTHRECSFECFVFQIDSDVLFVFFFDLYLEYSVHIFFEEAYRYYFLSFALSVTYESNNLRACQCSLCSVCYFSMYLFV